MVRDRKTLRRYQQPVSIYSLFLLPILSNGAQVFKALSLINIPAQRQTIFSSLYWLFADFSSCFLWTEKNRLNGASFARTSTLNCLRLAILLLFCSFLLLTRIITINGEVFGGTKAAAWEEKCQQVANVAWAEVRLFSRL